MPALAGRLHGHLVAFGDHVLYLETDTLREYLEDPTRALSNLVPGEGAGYQRFPHRLQASVVGVGVDDKLYVSLVHGLEESRYQ